MALTDAACEDDDELSKGMNRRGTALLAELAVTGGLLGAPVAAAQPVTTERVSIDAAGGDANGVSASPSVSADARFVAFDSLASDLVAGGAADGGVFLRDRATETTALVSVDTRDAGQSSVSADGRYVAYLSEVGPIPGSPTHVFVRDVVAGTTTPVDVGLGGGPANDGSYRVSISGDGRHVAFVSTASDLVPSDGNGQPDVFVRDLDAGTTVRANVDTADGDSGFAEFGGSLFADSPNVLSSDGRNVVFKSAYPDLVAGDGDGFQYDIFVRDLVAGVTTLVSDVPQVAVVENPAISPDGRRVAYTNVPFGFTRGGDVLVRDLATGATVQANVDTGDPASFSFSTPSLSADGRLLAFDSTPVNQDAGDNTPVSSNVFVRDLDAGTTTRVSLDTAEGEPNGSSFDPAISGDGRSVAFVSGASDLVAGDGNGLRDVFIADLPRADARSQLVALGELIEAFGLPKGTANSFTAKVRGAIAALDRGDTVAACGQLRALANHARAQRGKKLTAAQADQIIAQAAGIRGAVGCR
jgi:Tol biopolymer transport system component